ncbi:uncharacterized protein LOC101746599 [Bombyx mori]
MFIASDNKPWYAKIKDYMTHPEYEYATMNTIAVLEFDMEDENHIYLPPICIPGYSFNASNQLYAAGYTDENMFLEKTLHKLQYVNKDICDEFYNRAKLSEGLKEPKHYLCGFAVNNKKDCVWENGMVLASNSSGKWHLIGLSIKGPGCAAPARFIDIIPYLQWVDTVTSLEESYDYSFRRSGNNKDFKKDIEDIPAHVLFRSNNITEAKSGPMLSNLYPFDVDAFKYLDVTRIDKDAIAVTTFNTKYETRKGDCEKYTELVYHEKTRVLAPGIRGTASYKLSLYDMMVMNYTCVKIEIRATNRSAAHLYYKTYLDMKEGTAFAANGETPSEIIKVHPIDKLQTAKPLNKTDIWKPNANFEPRFVVDENLRLNIPNVNLMVQFVFVDDAVLEFRMYGKPYPKPSNATGKPKKTPKALRFMDNRLLSERFVLDEPISVSSAFTNSCAIYCYCILLLVFNKLL